MRIALLARRLYPPGGSERSLMYLKKRLESAHQVEIMGYYTDTPPSDYEGKFNRMPDGMSKYLPNIAASQVRRVQMATGMLIDVKNWSPDLIIAQHELTYTAAVLKGILGIPYISFLRDKSHLSDLHSHQSSILLAALTWIDDAITYPINGYSLARSDLVVANSEYISNIYSNRYSIDPDVIYPFVELDEYQVSPGDSILHINPTIDKGIYITIEVAKQMPEENFIVAGKHPKPQIEADLKKVDNIEYIGFVEDMRDVYSSCKIVIYPSQWDEPFGRVPIEAGASGIPTVASGTGGLPESVGTSELIVNSNQPSDYVSLINTVLDNYDHFSMIARENSVSKRANVQFQEFIRLIQSEISNLSLRDIV